MSPNAFKARYLASLPEVPPELDLGLDEFTQFPSEVVDGLKVSEADKRILVESGLPSNASPFLSFELPEHSLLEPITTTGGLADSYSRYRMIGHNGSGDMICIDEANGGAVVYLNHDWNMKVVFINSSVTALARSLCLFAELLRKKDGAACRRGIGEIDRAAMEAGNFWAEEIDALERTQS